MRTYDDALLMEATSLLEKLGRCPSCDGHRSYCVHCLGTKHCSCDRAGWEKRVKCTTCTDGFRPEVGKLLRKMRRR